jgi:hypothetical protein
MRSRLQMPENEQQPMTYEEAVNGLQAAREAGADTGPFVRRIVQLQIAYRIKEDLKGGECLMKEAYEELETDEEHKQCDAEMRRILKHLRAGA